MRSPLTPDEHDEAQREAIASSDVLAICVVAFIALIVGCLIIRELAQ